jgi:hypothetical protein
LHEKPENKSMTRSKSARRIPLQPEPPIITHEERGESITLLPLEALHPDPIQPRRTIPALLRPYWIGRPDTEALAYLFNQWTREISDERQESYSLEAAVLDPETTSDDIGPREQALMPIIALARRIRQEGFLHPINVGRRSGLTTIESGERRWLAAHLLHYAFPDEAERFATIPARDVETINVWRQASENLASDLNAIARARQLALLIMDLYTANGATFDPISTFETEQEFYGQVADGVRYPVPGHQRDLLLNATGLRTAVTIRQYRRLLRLPNLVWVMADDLNWSESWIQKNLFGRATTDAEIMALAEGAAVTQRYYAMGTPDLPPRTPSTRTIQGRVRKYEKWLNDLDTLRRDLDKMTHAERHGIGERLSDILKGLQPD